jgi:multiple antibiotic resistance protein
MGQHTPVADFVSLWVTINPFAVLAVFIAVTKGFDERTRRRTAVASVVVSYAVVLLFIAVGQIIIEAIGIPLHVFEIAGGIVLLLFAISLVIGQDSARELPKEDYSSVPIYPLAIPATAGPGTMLMAMLLTDNARFGVFQQAQTATAAGVVLAILLVMLLFAQPITRAIGVSGASVIQRIMGMILCAVAVNAIMTGVSIWLHLPKP